jgi:hypothetical protein
MSRIRANGGPTPPATSYARRPSTSGPTGSITSATPAKPPPDLSVYNGADCVRRARRLLTFHVDGKEAAEQDVAGQCDLVGRLAGPEEGVLVAGLLLVLVS